MSDGRRPAGEPMSGPEHDAWLREALRHAPDAGAAPPPTLRDAILAEARAAAQTAAPPRATPAPSLLGRVLEFWSWLARPQVAAGFASVMAATLVGMLWWDRPIDETMVPPPASPPVVAPPAARSEVPPATGSDRLQEAPRPPAAEPGPRDAAPAAGKIASPRAAEDAAALETARRQQQQQRQATREDTDLRARAATEAKPAARSEAAKTESKDDRKAEAPTPFPARTPVEADAAVRPAEQQAARPTSPPATPSPSLSTPPSTAAVPPPPTVMAAPPAPAMAQPLPAPAAPRDDAFAAPKKAESGEKERSLAKSRSATPPLPQAPATQAPAGVLGGAAVDSAEASAGGRSGALNSAAGSPPRQQPLAASPSARPMAPLLAALASDDTRWSRRLAGGESAAVDAPLRDWLAQVQAAAPRWDAATERSAGRELQDRPASTTSPTTLRLDRDGRPGAIVQIEEGGVRFDPLTGSAWFAPLPPEVVARLRATLPPAPR